MPRWARFLSCGFTGLLLALGCFLAAGYWQEGGLDYGRRLVDFMATPAFWHLVTLFALLTTLALLVARVVVNLFDLGGATAGFVIGSLVAFAYAAFLTASHAADWGGYAAAIRKVWPAVAIFAAPFGLAGAFSGWLWDRLD